MVIVTTLMETGFLVGCLMKMYPIDTAIVKACHGRQARTGDVEILTAASHMTLMSSAPIATRIAGAMMATVTMIVLAYFRKTEGACGEKAADCTTTTTHPRTNPIDLALRATLIEIQ
ncbi:2-hydroxycarboxylate transporter family protein [Caballeronia sp. S22]|uniref:2-hydroxycarboxylate transporter family protein n=1 Tax=Caballeronia sp. S22 TaxID=3137182 RepID=UPI0035307770